MEEKKPFPFLGAGLCLLIGGLVLMIPSVIGLLHVCLDPPDQISIIGGADAPTGRYLLHCLFSSPVFWIRTAGCTLGLAAIGTGGFLALAGILSRIQQKDDAQS